MRCPLKLGVSMKKDEKLSKTKSKSDTRVRTEGRRW